MKKMLGDRVKERREELGLDQADLAKAAGISNSAISQVELNKTKNLKLANLFAISDALNVEPRWLALEEGPKLSKRPIHRMVMRERLGPVEPPRNNSRPRGVRNRG